MIPAPNLCDNIIVPDSRYQNYGNYVNEQQETSMEYNYIKTEKYLEELILKHQDILP